MLTLKQLRDDKEAAVRRLAKKGVDARPVIDRIEQLDDRRKAIQQELDNCLSQQNQAAKMIGALMGQGKRDEAEAKKAEVAALKEKSVKLSAEMKQTACRPRSYCCPTSPPRSFPKEPRPRTIWW